MLKFATIASLLAVALAADNPYSTYPQVPKTASINGLADPIYHLLPECAKTCFSRSTAGTPCPYWDTGCLCVMTPWSEPVAECVANSCKGADVDLATSLAISKCSSAGVWEPYFIVGAKYTTMLQSAAAETAVVEETSSEPEPTPSEEETTSDETPAPTSSEDPVAESSSPAITSAPAVSSEDPAEVTSSSDPAVEESSAISAEPIASSVESSAPVESEPASESEPVSESVSVSASESELSTETVTSTHEEIVTITSCDENKCVETLSTVTATNIHTNIVTITSCEDNKCHETAAPAPKTKTVTAEAECVTITECIEDKCQTLQLSTTQVTTTVNKVETVYVSTCTEAVEVITSKSVQGTETVDVTITRTVSLTSASGQPTTVAGIPRTTAAVSTYEGAAASNAVGMGVAALLMALPFF